VSSACIPRLHSLINVPITWPRNHSCAGFELTYVRMSPRSCWFGRDRQLVAETTLRAISPRQSRFLASHRLTKFMGEMALPCARGESILDPVETRSLAALLQERAMSIERRQALSPRRSFNLPRLSREIHDAPTALTPLAVRAQG
jgi:hypothetical protein